MRASSSSSHRLREALGLALAAATACLLHLRLLLEPVVDARVRGEELRDAGVGLLRRQRLEELPQPRGVVSRARGVLEADLVRLHFLAAAVALEHALGDAVGDER